MFGSTFTFAVPILSLLLVLGGSTECLVSQRLRDNNGVENLCRFFLCDDATVVSYAYKWQLKGDVSSTSTATSLLHDALSRDLSSARRWSDLGDVLAQAGAISQAQFCFDRVADLGHSSAEALMGAGDFNLVHSDRHKGLRQYSQALLLTSSLDQAIFSRFPGFQVGPAELVAYGLPPDSRVAQAYLRYLISQPDPADFQPIWQWMVNLELTDRPIAIDYINFLVRRKLFKEAAETWTSQLGDRRSGYRTRQYLYNGDFEQEPLPVVFDWNLSPVEHVELTRDSNAFSGQYSLRIKFDGSTNIEYNQLSQTTIPRPGRYKFSAYIRTEDITTDKGPFFRVFDPENINRLRIETEQTLGTTAWHPVTATFIVTPETRVLEVRLMRHLSGKFDSNINGSAWIDQVSLIAVQ